MGKEGPSVPFKNDIFRFVLSGIHLWEVVRMKKMTALLLASVMTVSLAACGGNDDDDAASSGPGTQITAAEKDETEATHTIKIGSI